MNKRFFDIVLATIGLVIILPLFLIITILVYFDIGSPFFTMNRVGYNEAIFKMYKFKSMHDVDRKKGLISNAQRVTKLGRFLRNTSLDELPSLINILKGDMSFVGPRPLLVEYLPHYKEKHRRRHGVRPGLTGLAQIKGRNNTTWEERLNNDIKYIENQSFCLDMKILLNTFIKVIKKEGVESNVDLSIRRLDEDDEYKKTN
jgi:undecaprenyl phosphate N,N'-diacetylbacillosamine 1-phosphate transferase